MDAFFLPFVLCFFRVASFVAFLPPFGGEHLPRTVKIGLAIALTAFWGPNVSFSSWLAPQASAGSRIGLSTSGYETQAIPEEDPALDMRPWILWAWLAGREVLFGASLGWLLGTILVPLRVAGTWIGELMGMTMATVTSGVDSSSGNILAVLLEGLGVMMCYALGIHHGFLRAFDRCWDSFQVGSVWTSDVTASIIKLLTGVSSAGLAMTGPLTLMLILSTVALLFSMKQAPQFNLFSFGMPFRLLVGIIGLLLFFPDILASMTSHLQSFLNASVA